MKMAGDVLREMNDRPDVREFIDVSLKIFSQKNLLIFYTALFSG